MQEGGGNAAPERAIVARDLVKTYRGGVRALDGISFEVPAGTVFSLLGANGAGKSTTVKILATLSSPDSGQGFVAGCDIVREPERVRRVIGYVSQKSAVDLEATGRENLTLQAQIFGLRGQKLRRRVDGLLEQFHLEDAARRTVRTFSGGMQRKLDVAMGIVHQPKVLFLDEPTTGLDPQSRAEMWREITRLSAEEGLGVLLTTHYLEEADALAQRIAIVDRGRIVAEGSPDKLKSELRGDAIQIGLRARTEEPQVRAALGDLSEELRDLMFDGRTLRARVDSGARALPAVLSALEGGGVAVASATVSRPSLDDVYLQHTGRVFTEEEKGVTP